MKKLLRISSIILTMWRLEIEKIVNTRAKKLVVLMVLLFMISIAAFGGYQITNASLSSFLQGDIRSISMLTISMYLNASIYTFVFFILLKTIASDQDWLSTKCKWLPITPFERNLGYQIPLILTILVLIFFITGIILLPAFIIHQIGFGFSVAFFTGLLLQVLLTFSLLQLAYHVVTFFIISCKLPFGKFFPLFIVIILFGSYGLETLSIQGILTSFTDFHYNLYYLTSPLFLQIIGELSQMKVNLLFIVAIYVSIVLVSMASLLLISIQSEKRSLTFLRWIPIPRNKFGAVWVKEIKSQSRNEENVLNFFLILLLILVLNLKFNLASYSFLLLALAAMAGMIALNSFGNDKKMVPFYKIYDIQPNTIVLAKYTGLILLAVMQWILFCSLALYLPKNNEYWQALLIILNSTALFYLVGVIIPLDRRNPHIGLFAFVSFLFVLFPIMFIANYFGGYLPTFTQIGAIVLVEALISVAILMAHQWRFKHV
ncbi:hypothetical protein J2Z48_002789 [Croceifilum oryzae]|uniref:Uncharacterized protein n=1 Tax=Croceifilum oryzae TaxID=1553429 RepID=A0AAJ1WV34_9BACL|nr:hypothetical protein [Croceifilum oryzae]MDQ0418586.1 hypothetical protein [Croceifilum oryzae]